MSGREPEAPAGQNCSASLRSAGKEPPLATCRSWHGRLREKDWERTETDRDELRVESLQWLRKYLRSHAASIRDLPRAVAWPAATSLPACSRSRRPRSLPQPGLVAPRQAQFPGWRPAAGRIRSKIRPAEPAADWCNGSRMDYQ